MFKYFLLIFEFIYIKRSKIVFNLFFSILIGLSICFYDLSLSSEDISNYSSNSISVLGILLGFTASIFAIILTNSNNEIEESKKTKTKIKIYKEPFSLYDQLVIGCGFLILLLGTLLIINFLIPIYQNIIEDNYIKIFAVNISLIIFSVIQLVSSILEFYFIITKRK